ncbi:7-cyano-7-deazaguanine synthase [uncultured Roseobacter sp.]|uniref:7-cyano-7-deazaguanine synthase n=1 Tax=uncultured Roseobacter sp. TaxID=114847 RepID=UPI0026309938|nr:7-cyano-7-deazaguanine synthase [uncultured Roseobacter sp.]
MLLFSGGVESTALAFQHRPDRLLTVDYGQAPAVGELRAARHLAGLLDLGHDELAVDAAHLGSGDLVGKPKAGHSEVSEAWPFRNQFLITLAAMKYANCGLSEILIGTVATDRVHADGTPGFLERIGALIRCELPSVLVRAPAIHMNTEELVRTSKLPDELLGWTFSCHRASVACGQCRGCNKTLELRECLAREEQ